MAPTSPGDHCPEPYHVDLHVYNLHEAEADSFSVGFMENRVSEWKAHLLSYTRALGG
jgi:hypothetical protein